MPSILVVDDSEVDRRLVGGLLQKGGDYAIQFAQSGSEALELMGRSLPDVVVTDLQMPDKDGLELVNAIRIHHSNVPVILVTAHGSEALAAEALEQGAASYVPKSQLAEKLVATVADVLALARADRSYERLVQCLNRTTFDFTLDNDPGLIDPLVDLVQQMVSAVGLCDATGRFRVGVALREALLNALYRGNLEMGFDETRAAEQAERGGADQLYQQRLGDNSYVGRRISVQAVIDRVQAEFTIRDEGPGFAIDSVRDTDDLASIEPDRGRGMVLMRAFMDRVLYNEKGNEVTLVKLRDPARRGASGSRRLAESGGADGSP